MPLRKELSCGFVALMALTVVGPSAAEGQSAGDRAAVQGQTAAGKPEEEKRERRGFIWDGGPALVLGRDTRIDFRARLQAHARESDAEMGDASGFDLARRRVGMEGRVGGAVDFQIEYEIGDDDPWRDVYANYRRFEGLRVQAGKFKVPFSLDENTSTANHDFVYRSRAATQLAPGRDRGVMVHGRVLGRLLRYEAGVFARDGQNAATRNPSHVQAGQTAAGRVVLQPFRTSKSAASDLQFGLAMTTGELQEGISSLRGRTAMDASFYPATFWVRGRRQRVGLETRWRSGPFSLKAEYIRVTSERLGQSVEDSDLPPLVATGWYASGTWLVTGEKKSAGGDEPRRPVLRGGIGAVELAARVEDLTFRSGASSEVPSWSPRAEKVPRNGDRAATFGINWFPFRGIKIQANVIRDVILDPSGGPLPSRSGYWSKVLRFQFSL